MKNILRAYFKFSCRLDDLTLNGGQLYLDTKQRIINEQFTKEYIEKDINSLENYINNLNTALIEIKNIHATLEG